MLRSSLRLLCSAAAGSRNRVSVISLQATLPDAAPAISADSLLRDIKEFDASLSGASFLPGESDDGNGGLIGVAQWPYTGSLTINGNANNKTESGGGALHHRVDVILRNSCPLPPAIAQQCVDYAMYSDGVKDKIRQSQSTAYLAYRGSPEVPLLERYVAVAAVAGAIAKNGAVGVLNLNARTSVPASMLTKKFIDTNFAADRALDFLRAMPLMTLFCGFARYAPDAYPGQFGFRTHGAELLGLPNLATFSTTAEASSTVFYIFHALWNFMVERGAPLRPDEPIQLTKDANTAFKVRLPLEKETYLTSGVLVVEPVKGWETLLNDPAKPPPSS